jgi:hypothetical protein
MHVLHNHVLTVVSVLQQIIHTNANVQLVSMVKTVNWMLVPAKLNNHVAHHQMSDVNHSDGVLLLTTFASFKKVWLMVAILLKFTKAHVKVLMVHMH